MHINVDRLYELTEENALAFYHKPLRETDAHQLHNALGRAVMTLIAPDWVRTAEIQQAGRQAAYLSAEYLTGRMVYNNLLSLGVLNEAKALFSARGTSLDSLEEIEDDAFGNGGLGRLAACFLDSAAALELPLTGYGLRYKFGLFYQYFENGCQKEAPDDWSRLGDPWSVRREDLAVIVPIRDMPVRAVPYDMPVIGYLNDTVGTLRLWQTESLTEIDFAAFSAQDYRKASRLKNGAEDIIKFLYPNDSRPAGKLLRLKQQYVLSSASLQDMMRQYRAAHPTGWEGFPDAFAIQLNDTHPTLSIPEFIRLLTADGVSFEDAADLARRTFAYTNHTVMQEALEKWDLRLIRRLNEEIAEIIVSLDEMMQADFAARGLTLPEGIGIRQGQTIHMANLAMYMTFAVNGVAEIHTEILKNDVLKDWYKVCPDHFRNKTNGITQRRWLGLCNPSLTEMMNEAAGDDVLKHPEKMSCLRNSITPESLERFGAIKRAGKEALSALIKEREGIELPPDFLFDVQVKRLHEYKRQLLNAFSIIALYEGLKDGSISDFHPTAFIFGAKAAPGYRRAKGIIYLINSIAAIINADPDVNDKLRVCFVHNYDCSYAEKIIPAADVSEQISPAGTEASGTGNMKLMMNGAVTLGTMDGANIEIVREAGEENNYIFGATVKDIAAVSGKYDPKAIYLQDPVLHRAVDWLIDGHIEDPDGVLRELYVSLLEGASWHKPDHYYLFLDFEPYFTAKLRVNRDYSHHHDEFLKKCLINASGAGRFSSDRTIAEYAEDIWKI